MTARTDSPRALSAHRISANEGDAIDPDAPGGLRKLSVRDCEEFWSQYVSRRPGLRLLRGNHYSRWRPVAGADLFIAVYLTNHSVGLFIRGERGLSLKGASRKLAAWEPELVRSLGVPPVAHGCPFLSRLPLPMTDRTVWPAGQDWLVEREEFYHRVLARIVGGIDKEDAD